ncbi:MAG: hypothetical protein L6R37_002489 [Teloschistes peruensis]|nr:MAG: hypothetical protein L6R37_002489 [Teloschistes peruensis]
MRYNALFLAALSLECALAQPAHHRHHHKQRRDLADVDWNSVNYGNVDVSGVDFTKVNYGNGAPANSNPGKPDQNQQQGDKAPAKAAAPKVVNVIPLPVADTSKKPETSQNADTSKKVDTSNQSSNVSSSNGGIVSGARGGAQGTFGGQSTPVVTGDRITYIGNVGIPYGANMMFIPTSEVDKHKYTTEFKNVGQQRMAINVWNKAGRDGQANSGGCTEANLKFSLIPGESQAVAFDENTQAAFSRDCDKGAGGYPACVWGELDFGDQRPTDGTGQGNEGHSGFDRSSIPGGHGEVLTVSCLNCGGGAQTSSREKNNFHSETQLSAGGQANPGPAHFLAEMAF